MAAVPVAPAGSDFANSVSSRRTRTTNGTDWMSLGVTAVPDTCVWPVATALKDSLDFAGVNCPRHELEGHLDCLTGCNVSCIDFANLDPDQRIGRVDECHNRCEWKIGDARALAQRQIGDVAIRWRPNHGLVEVPLGAGNLRFQLVHIRLTL